MPRHPRSERKSSRGLRSAVLAVFLAAACYIGGGPGFSVKGSWDGALTDAKALPKGLVPLVGGLAFGEKTENGLMNFAVEDGHLVVNYADGPLSLRVDDDQAWQANFTRPDAALRASGKPNDDLKWDIYKHSDVEGLGAVDVNMSNGHKFGIAVEPTLPDVRGLRGTQFRAIARSHDKGGVQARLEAQRELMDGVDLRFGVENGYGVEEGESDVDQERFSHDARFRARLGSDSEAIFSVAGDMQDPRYNATFTQNLGKLLKGDAEAVVGADNGGFYGAFAGSRVLGRGLKGGYKTSGRVDNADPNLAHAASLSHKFGTLTLSQATGGPMSASLESDVARGPLRAQGRLMQTFDDDFELPSYNLTLTRAMGDLPGLSGEAQLGVDDATLDGIYGRFAARRELGKHASLELSTAGRAKSLEHSVKVAHDLGYARVVKRPDSEPRFQLGYQFNA